jgi:hypothetical protein
VYTKTTDMDFNPQSTFLAALKEVFKTDVAAIALNVEDLFYLANDLCPQAERIRYGAYLRFIDSLNKYGEPTVPHEQADLLLSIHDSIKAEQGKQRMVMLKSIMLGEKDWRRFVWLLQWQEKQERQKNAEAKQQAKEQKERDAAAVSAAKLGEPAEAEPAKAVPAETAQPQATATQPAPIAAQQQSSSAMYYSSKQPLAKAG